MLVSITPLLLQLFLLPRMFLVVSLLPNNLCPLRLSDSGFCRLLNAELKSWQCFIHWDKTWTLEAMKADSNPGLRFFDLCAPWPLWATEYFLKWHSFCFPYLSSCSQSCVWALGGSTISNLIVNVEGPVCHTPGLSCWKWIHGQAHGNNHPGFIQDADAQDLLMQLDSTDTWNQGQP